jgi:tetraacyldisaccharide 4'-kinase
MRFPDFLNPYAFAMMLRRYLYRKGVLPSVKASVPIISVGNISMGGTGKTPVTLHVAKYYLRPLGKKIAIVLRGYKRGSSGFLLISDGKNILQNVKASGDEAQLYAQELPEAIVICDEKRVRGAYQAAVLGAEVIILDDGFQHLHLKRDFDIVLINSQEEIPPVLPFGRGREPASALRDADIIIATNSDEENTFSFAEKPILKARTGIERIELYQSNGRTEVSEEFLSGKRILAVAGIANPERFKNTLVPLAASVSLLPLKDHAEYSLSSVENIIAKAKSEHCDLIATTTKDAVKMLDIYKKIQQNNSSAPPLAVIYSEIEFTGGEELLHDKIHKLFKK